MKERGQDPDAATPLVDFWTEVDRFLKEKGVV
jgi:hypothetical protein